MLFAKDSIFSLLITCCLAKSSVKSYKIGMKRYIIESKEEQKSKYIIHHIITHP